MDDTMAGLLGLIKFGDNTWEMPSSFKLQYLALYLQETQEYAPTYEFDKTERGPYSPTVASVLEDACDMGFVVEKERRTFGGDVTYQYVLTEDGAEALGAHGDDKVISASKEVAEEYGAIPTTNLVDDALEDFPRFKAAFRSASVFG